MTETAVENGIVDGARADNSEAEFNTADEAVHSAHNNVAELESEDAMNQQPKASTVLSMPPTHCQELNSEGLQEASSQCEVSGSLSTATGQ